MDYVVFYANKPMLCIFMLLLFSFSQKLHSFAKCHELFVWQTLDSTLLPPFFQIKNKLDLSMHVCKC